ncbi:MAG: NADH-quinone oxidoreductase subunit H, partial [Desulfobacterales bacterium]
MESFINYLFLKFGIFQQVGYVPTAAVVMLVFCLLVLNFFGLVSGFLTFFERKLAGWTNSRRGPNR